MNDLRTDAEALALAIEDGLISIAEVVAWADEQIASCDAPHIALCDLSMSRGAVGMDVARLLRTLPGEIDRIAASRSFVRIALQRLRSGADPSLVAHRLFKLASKEYLPPSDLQRLAWWCWEAIDLARDAHNADSETEVVERMIAAMRKFVGEDSQT